MRRHRLDRLQKLAQGAAVISMGVMSGVGTGGCQDKAAPKPQEPIHTNATATPTPDMMPHVNATAIPTPSAAPSTAPVPHTINAPPQSKPASSK